MLKQLAKLPHALAANGISNFIAYCWKAFIKDRFYRRQDPSAPYRIDHLYTNQLPHPVKCRYGSSDFRVFRQVFLADQYGPIQAEKDIKLVIDCGAYTGYSTVYFLNKYPQAHVIAVEPDGRNFELLEENLRFYAARVTLFHAGIWSHRTRLRVVQRQYGEWSTRVMECKENERGDLDAVDIPTLLTTGGYKTIDILKVDIEGAEDTLFGHHYERWIDSVNTIAIELHSPRSRSIFLGSLYGRNFDLRTSGELIIARRRTRD